MSEHNIRLAEALAENVLAALVYNEECAAQILLSITPDMFDNGGYKLIARRAFDYHHKYNKPPGRHLRDLFESELRFKDKQGESYRQHFDIIDGIAGHLQPQYVLDRLSTFIETAQLRGIIEDATVLLQNGDLEGAKLAFMRQEAQVSFSHGTWLHNPEEMLRFLNKPEDELFSSGIDELDNRGVRPARKTLMVMVAPPKSGKSWSLINQAKKNLIRHKRVLHITCENSEELTAKRYIQSLYAMSTYQLTTLQLPFFDRLEGGGISLRFETLDMPKVVDESQRKALTDKLRLLDARPRLLIKEFPSGTLTVPMIIAFIDMLERTEGFVPDLLIVDYPKMMRVNPREYRLDLGRILIDLRGIAVARNIAVSTVMQGSKLSKTARVVDATMVAEDYSVVGTADTIIAYSQTPEEKNRGLARILVDSARDSPDAYIVMISQSYATGQFCLDSVYMSQHLESEIAQHIGSAAKPEAATTDDEGEDVAPNL